MNDKIDKTFLRHVFAGLMDEYKQEMKQVIKEVLENYDYLRLNEGKEYDDVMNSRQVIKFLKISEPTLIKLEKQKKLKYKRIGRHKCYLLSDLKEYLRSA